LGLGLNDVAGVFIGFHSDRVGRLINYLALTWLLIYTHLDIIKYG